jgi:hypothetical protein
MTSLQDLARGTFHDWLDLPPFPTADSIRQQTAPDTFAAAFPDLMAAAMQVLTPQELQQAADDYQREAIATAQSEAAHEAAIQEYSK